MKHKWNFDILKNKTRRGGFEFGMKEHLLNHAPGLKVRNLSLYLALFSIQAELPAHEAKLFKHI